MADQVGGVDANEGRVLGIPLRRMPVRRVSRAPRAVLLAAALAFGAGQAAGAWARAGLPPGTERTVIPHVLSLMLLHNRGVAFGLLGSLAPGVLVAVALTVLAVALYNRNAWPPTSLCWWGFGLVGGGALANVVDRVRFGYVVDYLDVHVWPVFNVADSMVVIGAGLLLLALVRGPESGGGR